MPQIQNRHQVVLITGASSGIGREFAHIFAENQYQLILTARSAEALQLLAAELKSRYLTQVRVIPADLGTDAGFEGFCEKLERESVLVDILVNNAGFGDWGSFTQTSWKRESEMIDLNVKALVRLTKWAVGSMKSRGFGRVIQVASTAGFVPGPFMSVYFATKAFVLSFSSALTEELRGTGVTVTALCPGPTQTGFASAMPGNRLFTGSLPSAREVADYGFRAMSEGKAVAIHGWRNRLSAFVARWIPRGWVARIVRMQILPPV